MASLYHKQAKKYAEGRPTYPPELFRFIASKTPRYRLAWDVATGSGQAATSLAGIYETVVATDASAQQLAHAPPLPNVLYRHTPPSIPPDELDFHVAPPGTVDVVTISQALHWFDLGCFYGLVHRALRRPSGVLAAWCYSRPRVDDRVDAAYDRFYAASQQYWAPRRWILEERYAGLEFPFDPVEGEEHTGPFEFSTAGEMDLPAFLAYAQSSSGYQTAMEKGVELLDGAAMAEFRRAWGGDPAAVKVVKFPVYLRIGRVRD